MNPGTSARFGELIGLYKRKYYQRTGKGNPFVNFLQTHFEPAIVELESLQRRRPGRARDARSKTIGADAEVRARPRRQARSPAAKALESWRGTRRRSTSSSSCSLPFTLDQKGPFSCANTHAAYARLSPEDRAALPWYPEKIDWADYWMNQHMPAHREVGAPVDGGEVQEGARAAARRTRRSSSLVDQMAERHEHAVALRSPRRGRHRAHHVPRRARRARTRSLRVSPRSA